MQNIHKAKSLNQACSGLDALQCDATEGLVVRKSEGQMHLFSSMRNRESRLHNDVIVTLQC